MQGIRHRARDDDNRALKEDGGRGGKGDDTDKYAFVEDVLETFRPTPSRQRRSGLYIVVQADFVEVVVGWRLGFGTQKPDISLVMHVR